MRTVSGADANFKWVLFQNTLIFLLFQMSALTFDIEGLLSMRC